MRLAANQATTPDGRPAFTVEYHCEESGWIPAQVGGDNRPHAYAKADANHTMMILRRMLPAIEFRVYPALKGK